MRRGEDTPQYKIIKRIAPELKHAIKDDLCDLSDRLLGYGLISDANHEAFITHYVPSDTRASNLIRTVLNKIKLDARHYATFVSVLKEKEYLYESVLEKIRSTEDEGIVTIGQSPLPRSSVGDQSDSETSPFLHTPQSCHVNQNSRPKKPPPQDKLLFLMGLFCFWTILVIFFSIIFIVIITVTVSLYNASGCLNDHYQFTLLIIILASFVVLSCNISLSICAFCLFNNSEPYLCSTRTCLLCITPWFFILLIWLCAYTYMCTK